MKGTRYIEGIILSLLYYGFSIFIFATTDHLENAPELVKFFFYPAEWAIEPFTSQHFELQWLNLFLFSVYFTWAFFCVLLDIIHSANKLFRLEQSN
jgi:hypothetical protein